MIHLPHKTEPPASLWSEVIQTIQQGQRFLITAHQNPDGDAIGSVLGLYALLRALGKEVFAFNDTPYSDRFHFLPQAPIIQTQIPEDARFDVTILCDCGELSRAPKGMLTDRARMGRFIVLDHHLTSGLEGDINLNDINAPATGMLILQLAKRLHLPLSTPFLAAPLYCALVSDTGGFRYQKTTPNALRAAAELLEAGVDPWEISSALYESNPLSRQRLLALVLPTLEIHQDGQIALLHTTEEMYQATGTSREDTDGFVNFARAIQGVEIAGFFHPVEDGWKVSLRSRGRANVSEAAASFGGGGHHQAAGAFFKGSLHDAKAAILAALAPQFHNPS
jgi:phosphoesterase RecJ-like protein